MPGPKGYGIRTTRSLIVNIAMFYHSLVSDWNHGNAHFLRGIVSELISRGHEVTVYEPVNAWSRWNLVERHGPGPIEQFHQDRKSTRLNSSHVKMSYAVF